MQRLANGPANASVSGLWAIALVAALLAGAFAAAVAGVAGPGDRGSAPASSGGGGCGNQPRGISPPFVPNMRIDDDSSSNPQYYPAVATDGSGNVYAVWQDLRNGNWDIYFAKSTDGGVTFGTNVRVDDDTT